MKHIQAWGQSVIQGTDGCVPWTFFSCLFSSFLTNDIRIADQHDIAPIKGVKAQFIECIRGGCDRSLQGKSSHIGTNSLSIPAYVHLPDNKNKIKNNKDILRLFYSLFFPIKMSSPSLKRDVFSWEAKLHKILRIVFISWNRVIFLTSLANRFVCFVLNLTRWCQMYY